MSEKKEDQYKLFTRLGEHDRRRLKWLVFKSNRNKQDIGLVALRKYMTELERDFGTDPDIEVGLDDGVDEPVEDTQPGATLSARAERRLGDLHEVPKTGGKKQAIAGGR